MIKKIKLKVLKIILNARLEIKLPLIVHSRNAENDTFNILNNYKNTDLKILMHCFTGSMEFAKNYFN